MRGAGPLRNLICAVIGGVCLILGLNAAFPPPIEQAADRSILISDRAGKPLRAFSTERGAWRFAADLDRIDPLFVDALLRVEDKRFYAHGGVDWAAMVRAALTSARAGHIVSGGSTITMQTARLLEPRPRNLTSKLIEMLRAMQLEARLSKEEILELYLTLAPYGGNLEGVHAASLGWFGHEADRLGDEEIALLIALPQSPEMRRPDRHPDGARSARARIARKLEALGIIDPQRRLEVEQASLPVRHGFPVRAWHASAQIHTSGRNDMRSTLDAALQGDLERLLLEKAEAFGGEVQLAAIVVDIPTRAVRASIGSASRARPGGWLDLTRTARSPGSTLKPFIYAMTFDDGVALPGTLITDLPRRFAAYQPENFDRSFRGDVSIADALQHSLNIPAVIALDRIGPERFAANLSLAGARPRVSGPAKDAGLALALGGAGLTLQELGLLYAALGDDGIAKPLVWWAADEAASAAAPGQRMMSPTSAHSIMDILKNAPAPEGHMPGGLTRDAPEIAFKTGTSYGFRDAWAAGIVGDYAIIVWVGRADGAPRPGHVGRSDALPVLFEIADRATLRLQVSTPNVDRIMQVSEPRPQAALTRFSSHSPPPEILFPPNEAELWAGAVNGKAARAFVLAGRGEGPLRWFIDGVPCEVDAAGLPIWSPSEPGFYLVSAVDAVGRETRRRVRVIS